MIVEVFKKDIAEAEKFDCEKCVIAKALCRLPFPEGATKVSVGSTDFHYIGDKLDADGIPNKVKTVQLPRLVQKYILKFDRGEKVIPTVFYIPGT